MSPATNASHRNYKKFRPYDGEILSFINKWMKGQINCITYKYSFEHHRKHCASIRQKSQWMLRRKSWLFEEKHETKTERTRKMQGFFNVTPSSSSSSSIGTTAHCGLWPVEQCPSMFSYLPPTLSIFTPSTWRSLSTSSFHLSLGLPLLLVLSSSWLKIFLGILSSSILSRWPNQLILCPFIHCTIFSPLLISSSSRFVRLFHSSVFIFRTIYSGGTNN